MADDDDNSDEIGGGRIGQLVREWSKCLPNLDPSAFAITLKIHQINTLAIRATNLIAAKFDITAIDMNLLIAIRRDQAAKPVRPTDLRRQFDLGPSAITYRVDRLYDLGLVDRIPDPSDRRAVHVKLTPKGETTIEAVLSEFNAEVAKKIADVDKTRGGRRKLNRLLSAYLRKWEEDAAG